MITDLAAFMKMVEAAFPAYRFKLQLQGRTPGKGQWARAFVLRPEEGIEVTIGRINFWPETEGWKVTSHFYKPGDYDYTPGDDFFYQFDCWVASGKVIDLSGFVEKAKAARQVRNEEHQKWRAEHPKKGKRKGLDKRWMGEFRRLVLQAIEEAVS